MKGKLVWSLFWALVAFFALTIGVIFFPAYSGQSARLSPLVLIILFVCFALLGAALLAVTLKTAVTGKLKAYLLLSGAAAVGLLVFVVLHNLVSALFNMEEAVFFILATIVCPAGFLVGAVGTVVIAVKNRLPGISR